MPELPEAETIVRDLRRRVPGHCVTGLKVTHADVLGPGLNPRRLARELKGLCFRDVGRRGKNVVLHFDRDRVLAVNLGMTGRLVVSESPRAAELRHVAVRLDLDDGHALLYDDTRRFGRLELHTTATWAERSAELGLEPLAPEFTAAALHKLAGASRTRIRNWLLDQRRVAGVGNIYANEALFRAGVHPARPANCMSAREAAKLRDALVAVLTEAIAARGTTLSDYRDAAGEAGGFEPRLQIYGREGEPCPVCGQTIQRVVLTNRSAFFCPRCQR
ncbi:MAG: DNA-formamidopyrimidine glycosylase [Gemmatimonadetes bacterium]|nr:DNA-formamidopyrimidine glycosylase [Gemmatimonadota bacterium]